MGDGKIEGEKIKWEPLGDNVLIEISFRKSLILVENKESYKVEKMDVVKVGEVCTRLKPGDQIVISDNCKPAALSEQEDERKFFLIKEHEALARIV